MVFDFLLPLDLNLVGGAELASCGDGDGDGGVVGGASFSKLGAGPEFFNNTEAPDNFVGPGGSPGPEYYNNMEAPNNTAIGGTTMLGAGPEFFNNMEAPDNFVGFGGSPGPEYYNNMEASDNCVGGTETSCVRPAP
jgi:hypothetical protein